MKLSSDKLTALFALTPVLNILHLLKNAYSKFSLCFCDDL